MFCRYGLKIFPFRNRGSSGTPTRHRSLTTMKSASSTPGLRLSRDGPAAPRGLSSGYRSCGFSPCSRGSCCCAPCGACTEACVESPFDCPFDCCFDCGVDCGVGCGFDCGASCCCVDCL